MNVEQNQNPNIIVAFFQDICGVWITYMIKVSARTSEPVIDFPWVNVAGMYQYVMMGHPVTWPTALSCRPNLDLALSCTSSL